MATKERDYLPTWFGGRSDVIIRELRAENERLRQRIAEMESRMQRKETD